MSFVGTELDSRALGPAKTWTAPATHDFLCLSLCLCLSLSLSLSLSLLVKAVETFQKAQIRDGPIFTSDGGD